MKTHLFLSFDYQDTDRKMLISTIMLPHVVRDVKFIEVADFSPSAVLFVFTCDQVTNYYTNCINNLLSVGLGGVAGNESYKAATLTNIRELTVRMKHISPKNVYTRLQKYSRAHVILHSGDLKEEEGKEMKKTSFLLKLEANESKTRQSVTFKLPKPLFDCKYMQVVNWFGAGGYDYITCPQIKATFSNDPVVKEPVLAYGVGGVSKNTQLMELDSPGLLDEIQLSMIKPNEDKYSLDHSFVHLIVYHS